MDPAKAVRYRADVATSDRLASLLALRQSALGRIAASSRWLCDMAPAERLAADEASRQFRESDAAIVAILKTLPHSVVVDGISLHLTRDRMNFVMCERATRQPIHTDGGKTGYGAILLKYPVGEPMP